MCYAGELAGRKGGGMLEADFWRKIASVNNKETDVVAKKSLTAVRS